MQVGVNQVKTGCFSISLTNEKNNINLENAYPLRDEEGMKSVPFSFTVTNTCEIFASYKINLEMLEGTTLNSNYVKIMLNREQTQNLGELPITNTTIDKSIEARELMSRSLGSNDSEDYTLRIWIDEKVTLEDDVINKNFLSKIIIEAEPSSYTPVENGIIKLNEAILANEYQTTVEKAKEKIENKQSVDFTKTAPLIDWEEKHETNLSTLNITMPHLDLVGSQDPGTENLTNTNIYPAIGTGYTFDKETGMYSLTGVQYIDPTELDYSTKEYFTCDSNSSISNNVLTTYSGVRNRPICYKITSVTKNSATIGTHKAVKYTFKKYNYTQQELESDKSDKGIYTMEDDWGTSYYYRGNVNNNYVKFGGFYWRIIRINGDGSIRLLYAGDDPNAQGDDLFSTLTDEDLNLNNTRAIPFNKEKNKNGYVGYMYGNTLGVSYEQEYANKQDSNIKKYLDSWYKQNIEEKGLARYIADSGFCNDRSLSNRINNGDGGTDKMSTEFAPVQRFNDKQPILICPNASNDLFTLSGNSKGNGFLIKPIGLITIDELMLTGHVGNYLNRMAYTFSNKTYWSMSPAFFSSSSLAANVYTLNYTGYIGGHTTPSEYGVRPVINLSHDIEITKGIGTSNEPFEIKE